MNFSKNKGLTPMAIEKIKILGAVLELSAKLHCQFSPFVAVNMGWIGSSVLQVCTTHTKWKIK